ncbi:MAG: cytochrome c3 family protein [Acidobacteria bacterium]|nr:cytochrome c3 family protein [Acidobacteriota bacterium]
MAQIFRPSANLLAKSSIVGGAILVAALGFGLDTLFRSPYNTNVRVARDQPVPFSHKHHVAGIGIDCRYCHTSVEKAAFAGIPPTETCMSCHSQIWSDAPMLEPVRESFRSGKPLQWTRVHDLPQFVYFNHSIHVTKGMGCAVCHGRVDQMPLMYQENTLFMEWCLDCHRQPEKYIRPKDKVFEMGYKPAEDQSVLGARLVQEYKVRKLTDCAVCHR